MKCPQCDRPEEVVCHGRRYAMYPAGCLALLGPFVAILHQASTPVEYECRSCKLKFARRSTAAKVALLGIILFVAYLVWLSLQDVSRPLDP